MSRKLQGKSNYSVHPGVAKMQKWVAELKQKTGGLAKGDRITHSVPITSMAEIDAEVKRWLQTAYELDAE